MASDTNTNTMMRPETSDDSEMKMFDLFLVR